MLMTNHEYLENGGEFCPSCDGTNIISGPIKTDVGIAWRNCSCNYCGTEWIEQYELMGFKLIV